MISDLSWSRSSDNSRLDCSVTAPLSLSLASIFEIVSSIIIHPASLELVLFLFEKNIKSRHRAVAARDVLLHLDLLAVAEFLVRVNLLFQHSQVVAHHHDLMEEN